MDSAALVFILTIRQKYFDKFASSRSITPQISPIPVNPFYASVLTSSPVNIDHVRTANSAFRELIASGESLPNDAKNYLTV